MSEATVLPVAGKFVAIVPETHYNFTKQACPFPECKSTLTQAYITDNKEMEGDFIADTMQCPECQGTYVVVSMPKLHISGSIILDWTLTEKGVSKYGTKGTEAQSEQGSEAGGTSPNPNEVHEGDKPDKANAENEAVSAGS